MDPSMFRQYGPRPVRPHLIAGYKKYQPHHADFRLLHGDGSIWSDNLNPWTMLLNFLAAIRPCVREITMGSEQEIQRN